VTIQLLPKLFHNKYILFQYLNQTNPDLQLVNLVELMMLLKMLVLALLRQ
jgi:hypothetical protein